MRKGIAKKIFLARNELQLGQEELAEILGVSRQAVTNWETGLSEPKRPMLLKLSKNLKKPASYFYEEDTVLEAAIEASKQARQHHVQEPRAPYGVENQMLQVLMKLSLQIDSLTGEIRNLKQELDGYELKKTVGVIEALPTKIKKCVEECFKK